MKFKHLLKLDKRNYKSYFNTMQPSSGLEYPICLQQFTDPKELPCQHTFCRNLLQERIHNYATVQSVSRCCIRLVSRLDQIFSL